jgi:hypothetical protein
MAALDIDRYDSDPPPGGARRKRQFLGIHFECCNTYCRIYKTADGTAYAGSCPRCGMPVRVPIGKGGTSQRFFRAR